MNGKIYNIPLFHLLHLTHSPSLSVIFCNIYIALHIYVLCGNKHLFILYCIVIWSNCWTGTVILFHHLQGRCALSWKKRKTIVFSCQLPCQLYIYLHLGSGHWTHLEGPEVTNHMTPSPESGPLTDHMADTKSKPMTDPRTNPMTDPMTNLIINHLINTIPCSQVWYFPTFIYLWILWQN